MNYKASRNEITAQRESIQAGYPADVQVLGRPGSETWGWPSKPLKNKHVGVEIHNPERADAHDPRCGAKNFGQKNIGLLFRSLQASKNREAWSIACW